jgi:phosphatidylglycerol:prolipoprotein diacylglycerol transferase
MRRELFHICGPFSIYSYGVAICIGLLLVNFLIRRHPQFTALNLKDRFIDILIIGIVAGIAGGRLLFVLTELEGTPSFSDIFSYWEGGFSVLGSIISIILTLVWYTKKVGIPFLPLLDLFAIYAPLLQGVSRFGCFFAGCCYGAATNLPWAFTYTDPNTVAPMCVPMHPTQLYSAGILLLLFAAMYFFIQRYTTKQGQLLSIYLILASLERFTVDFWRADRTFISSSILPEWMVHYFSVNQLIALGIILVSSVTGILLSMRSHKANTHYEHI